jgi:signal transduction histidine kinase
MRKTAPPIGYYLVALVVLAVAPLLVIACALIWRDIREQRGFIERGLLQTAGALSLAVDGELANYRALLETLAESDHIDPGNFSRLHAMASRVAEKRGVVFISLFDRNGKQVFNTARTYGTPLPTPFLAAGPASADSPPVGNASSLKHVFASGKAGNSDLFISLITGQVLFTIDVPVIRRGEAVYALNAALSPEVITRLLVENEQFRGHPAVVVDRNGFVVGRWAEAGRFAGRPANDTLVGLVGSGKMQASGTGDTLEGIPIYYSYARSPATGWSVSIGVERASILAALRRDLAIGAALALIGLVVSAILALALANRLRSSIVALAAAASRNAPPGMPAGVRTREIEQVREALVDAGEVRASEARERENRLIAEARKDEAEGANRRKDEFIALLSHELRNPLAALRNSVQLLETIGKLEQDPRIHSVVGVMGRQTSQLTRLVNDLMDISRISRGKMELQRERLDLGRVLDHAVETTGTALRQKGHRLTRRPAAGPLHVEGDAQRLAQVFANLLDNACKYTPTGGEIALSLEAEGPLAVVRVQDNGEGIDPAFLPRIFEAFSQGENQANRAGGLGLGLALAKELIEAHGGRLEAQSAGRNAGSLFIVRLALA